MALRKILWPSLCVATIILGLSGGCSSATDSDQATATVASEPLPKNVRAEGQPAAELPDLSAERPQPQIVTAQAAKPAGGGPGFPETGHVESVPVEPPASGSEGGSAVRRAADVSSEEPRVSRRSPTILRAAEGPIPPVRTDVGGEPAVTAAPSTDKAATEMAQPTPDTPMASAPATAPSTLAETSAPAAIAAPAEAAATAPAADPASREPMRLASEDPSSPVGGAHPLRGAMEPAVPVEGSSPGAAEARSNPLRSSEQAPGLLPQSERPLRPVSEAPRPIQPSMESSPPAPRMTSAASEPQSPLEDHRSQVGQPSEPKLPTGSEIGSKTTILAEVSTAAASSGKHGGGDFDPIKENGPIFVDWPEAPPKLAFLISGRQEGYLEPCGCAGLDRMKGGVSRRHMLIRQLREQKQWPLVCLDVGALSKGFGKQAELKFHTTFEAYRRMGYNAIGLGLSDLRLPAGELLSVTTRGPDDQPSPFVSANVGLFAFDAAMVGPYQVIQSGATRVGVTAVLGKQYQQEVRNPEVMLAVPEEKLEPVVRELKGKADYLVLLAFATIEESKGLARRFPEFQMVVTAGGAPEPPARAEVLAPNKALLVEVGEKGMNVTVVALYDDPQQPYRYQRVPLDSRFPNSRDMRALMASYQDRLKDLGFEGLGLRPAPHPQRELNGRFVGSEKCEACHEASYKVWKKSGHAKAYDTLVQADPPRHHDPECISCHVIGWNPQKYFPYESGFWSQQSTPKMIDVGCETCHGPGEAHVAAEMGSNADLQAKLQKAMVVTKEESQKHLCATCHDLDNSPAFKFETYWPKVEHYEKE